MPQLSDTVQRRGEKEQKQQRINGIENILLKSCTTKGVLNYDQKSSGSLDSGAAWNSFRSEISELCNYRKDTRHTRNFPGLFQKHSVLIYTVRNSKYEKSKE